MRILPVTEDLASHHMAAILMSRLMAISSEMHRGTMVNTIFIYRLHEDMIPDSRHSTQLSLVMG